MIETKTISFHELGILGFDCLPFQTKWYFKIFQRHFVSEQNILIAGIYENNALIGYGGFEKMDNQVLFLGMKPVLNGQELTDYGDIVTDEFHKDRVGEIWPTVLRWLKKNGSSHFQLDYVREDSQTYEMFKNQAQPQAIAPYIDLLQTWDGYLLALDRVERKELKRKMKRLDTISHEFECYTEISRESFEEFVRVHKLSSREKSIFMSEEMKQFFWDLVSCGKSQWQTNLCFLTIEDKYAAGILTFENDTKILGYNSGYDPSFNYYSAGLMLHAHKIREAIDAKKTKYDFMRGGERYKFDLGGKKLQLYKILLDL